METISKEFFNDLNKNLINESITRIQTTIDYNNNQITILKNDSYKYADNENLINSLEFCNNILLYKITELNQELLDMQIQKELHGTREKYHYENDTRRV